jgi:hypothetical protein
MKLSKILLPLAAVALAPIASHATILASDSFVVGAGGYSTGSLYNANPTNSGFAGAWSNANSQTTGNLNVSSSGLTHPLVGSATGGSIFANANNTGRTVTRAFSSSVTTDISALIASNGTLSFSGLIGGADWVHQASGGSTIQLGLGANRNHDQLNNNGGVFARVGDNGGLFLSVTSNASVNTQTSVATLAAGQTYLFSIAIDFNSAASHTITLDLFDPIGSTTPIASQSTTISSTLFGIDQLSYLVFNHNNTGGTGGYTSATTPRFDEFNLVAIPEPSTYAAIFGLGALGLVVLRRRMKKA